MAEWQGRRVVPHRRRYRGMAGVIETTGALRAVRATAEGATHWRLDDRWYVLSRFYRFPPAPPLGTRVSVRLETYNGRRLADATPFVVAWREE